MTGLTNPMTAGKVWMNVTSSMGWSRSAVGIIRVEVELARALEAHFGQRFARCIWRAHGGFESLQLGVQGSEQASRDHLAAVAARTAFHRKVTSYLRPVGRKQALVLMAQAMLSLLPTSLRAPMTRLMIWMSPALTHAVSWMVSQKRTWGPRFRGLSKRLGIRPSLQPFGPAGPWHGGAEMGCLQPGDVLISVGLDWDTEVYKAFYSLREQGVRVVACCYDTIPVLFPQYCLAQVAQTFTGYFATLADSVDHVICISQQTQKDFHSVVNRIGGHDAVPSSVFRLGDQVGRSLDQPSMSQVLARLDLTGRPFILYVSTIERRKNHEVLYWAYHRLASQGLSDKLPLMVFVGMKGWGVDQLMTDLALDPLTDGLVRVLHQIDDHQLCALYQASLFCVFPSLYEGWGLPVSEALGFGKAVICSNQGSLPEVGQDLVHYLDPWDVGAWAAEIYKMSTETGYRQALEDRIRRQYRPYSWQESAASVIKVIEALEPKQERLEKH